jgi:hypothetical protein
MRSLLAIALYAVVVTASTLAAAMPDGGPRLRPMDARLTQLLRDGAARSTTFKALVDRIEASNVIVYAAFNPLMKPSLSGTLTWMTRAGGYRYVRASISTDLTTDQMIATLAHELQHAVEVIQDETVIDENSLVAMYRKIGQQSSFAAPSRWETEAAQQTGFQVRRELAALPSVAMARVSEWSKS